MKNLKTILIGTAAATFACVGLAQAADAPMREPVYRCDARGFIELPGTDVCFKVGGFARLVVWGVNDDYVDVNEGNIEENVGDDRFGMYAQGRLNFDARRSTDHGTVRAFVEVQASDNNGNTGGPLQLRHAFAQMGNWVFGKTWSTYLHGASDPNGTDISFAAHSIRINQIRYTQSVGNGLSVAIAIEDQAYENDGRTRRLSGGVPTPVTFVNYGNGGSGENNVPNFVANINYAVGSWDAQLSGVLHQNEYADPAGTDELGYGIMFSIAGELTDQLNIFGKVNYTHANPSYQFDWFNAGNNTGDDHNQFGIMGGLSYEATDMVTFQAAGFWGNEDNNGNSASLATAAANCSRLQAVEADGACAVDQDVWGGSLLVSYRPASGFEFMGELLYRNTSPAVGPDTDEVIGVFQAAASF
ncbi:porin [Tepidamorphus sp. 3E244]|uniref:porin n=1 Tax=Tepidamorphus sp. 3E244 TaxID=3385498 RepID=UPI0038FD2DC3